MRNIDPATEVPDEIERWHRSIPSATHWPERARHGDVVDVVAGALCQRTVLPVAGHASVDQLRVARRDVGRSEAETLGDARTEALDEHVGLLAELQDQFTTGVALQVDGDRRSRTIEEVPRRFLISVGVATFDSQDVRSEVGHQHAGVGARPDAGQFDDLQSVKWSAHIESVESATS